MLKADAQSRRAKGDGHGTAERILSAAIETLREEGFAGASARSIARTGGFNQALIFYHFGSVEGLLLAALDRSSEVRLEAYGETVEGVDDPEHLLEVARRLYREDLEGGFITVLNEMLAGSVGNPRLGAEVVKRMDPWLELAEGQIDKVLRGTGVSEMLDAKTLAFGLLSLYIGVDLIQALDADHSRADALFAMAEQLAPLASLLSGADG